MIIRIVKMTFQDSRVPDFLENFEKHKELIRNFEGCEHLELLQQEGTPNVFFTYSWWVSQAELENYRNSRLFREVWTYTKSLFSERPEAWSLNQLVKL